MTSAKGIGIPVKLMHEAEGHIVTVSSLMNMLPCLICLYVLKVQLANLLCIADFLLKYCLDDKSRPDQT